MDIASIGGILLAVVGILAGMMIEGATSPRSPSPRPP
jgi:flagellar motor component MotA